jgi:hypothetical protein
MAESKKLLLFLSKRIQVTSTITILISLSPMAEAVQQSILETLDKNGSIDDTRLLVLPGQTAAAATAEDQSTIIAALNSLLSRDVR